MKNRVVKKTSRRVVEEVYESELIGIVYDLNTKAIRMVIDPTNDYELDDPAFITAPEDHRVMIKVSRSEIPNGEKLTQESVAWIESKADHFLQKAILG